MSSHTSAFREPYWRGDSAGGYSERVALWVESPEQVERANRRPNGEKGKPLADAFLSRLSLLQQTANRDGIHTGQSALSAWPPVLLHRRLRLIPRFLWPDKPSVNDANHWYQVSYRLTSSHGNFRVFPLPSARSPRATLILAGWATANHASLGDFSGILPADLVARRLGPSVQQRGAVLVPQLLTVQAQMAVRRRLSTAGLGVVLVLIPTLKSRTEERQFRRGCLCDLPISQKCSRRTQAFKNRWQ